MSGRAERLNDNALASQELRASPSPRASDGAGGVEGHAIPQRAMSGEYAAAKPRDSAHGSGTNVPAGIEPGPAPSASEHRSEPLVTCPEGAHSWMQGRDRFVTTATSLQRRDARDIRERPESNGVELTRGTRYELEDGELVPRRIWIARRGNKTHSAGTPEGAARGVA